MGAVNDGGLAERRFACTVGGIRMSTLSPTAIPGVRARFVSLDAVRDWPAWQEGLRDFAKDHRYHEIVADTLGFDCHAIVLEDGAGIVLAIQPCFLVQQDLVIAASPPVRTAASLVRRLFPSFLRPRVLMAGCAAGEGHLTVPSDSVARIHDALRDFARKHGARLVVWKDMPARYRDALRVLNDPPAECAHVASMPATRLPLSYASFDDYLAQRLSHATRKNLRRKFRHAAALAPSLRMTVTNDLGDAVDEALALYEQVLARSRMRFERLNKTFLQQLTARMGDRVRFFLWRSEGRLVAFSLCFVHEGVLYDEYLGLDYSVALDLHLYFLTFRDILTWAIAQGLTAYHSTPLSYEPKLHLGFDLLPLDLYFAIPMPGLNRLARPFLTRASPTQAEPALARFENAHAMSPRLLQAPPSCPQPSAHTSTCS